MLEHVKRARSAGLVTAILSDQTNWLDEIEQTSPFYQYFDYVYNSFKGEKSKRDASVFTDICSIMGLAPEEVLFIDDNPSNIERASGKGLKTIRFTDREDFERQIKDYITPG